MSSTATVSVLSLDTSDPSVKPANGRPQLVRQDTEAYLSYYRSPLADGGLDDSPATTPDVKSSCVPLHERVPSSSRSSSSSEYSSDSVVTEHSDIDKPISSPQVRHRASIPSEGGADRRRLAIVQIDASEDRQKLSTDFESGNPPSNLRTRRGIETSLGGLALVAPPDASPNSYSNLTPPSTAPIISASKPGSAHSPESGHQRSVSEAVDSAQRAGRLNHKISRDVGIVGTTPTSVMSERPAKPLHYTDSPTLRPPIFQMPQSRSPSPGSSSGPHDSNRSSPLLSSPGTFSNGINRSPMQPILTPEIGQKKGIDVPVAPPVIMNLGSGNSLKSGSPYFSGASLRDYAPSVVVQSPTIASPLSPTSYLHYTPGVHATAGPLPPPPRAFFNIDTNTPPPPRPPRLQSPPPTRRRGDIEAVKQALQLPPSVSAKLASRAPSPAVNSESPHPSKADNVKPGDVASVDGHSKSSDSNPGSPLQASAHRREGAFPPSTICPPAELSAASSETGSSVAINGSSSASIGPQGSMDALVADVGNAINDMGIINASDVPPPTIIEPPHPGSINERPTLNLRRNESWVSSSSVISKGTTQSSDDEQWPSPEAASQTAPSPPPHPQRGTPSPPPKSIRNSLTANFKRFSNLPRTPSHLSSESSFRQDRATSTPSPPALPSSRPRPKIRATWPAAMSCADIVNQRSIAERCSGYARKINELAMYDTGLGDWVEDMGSRGSRSARQPKRNTIMPSGPSSAPFSPQPRHPSHGSIMSEATFPRRPDASTATDLSIKSVFDMSPVTVPPPLPYPSLAQQRASPSRSSTIVGSPPTSMRQLAPPVSTSKHTGFFASLGRKTSMSRKDKGLPSSPASPPSARLTKSPPAPIHLQRPINVPSSPSVPGGPRAPPNRVQRSQTIMISAPFSAGPQQRRSSLARRPSLYGMSSDTVLDISQSDAEFARQVDKLADLLPQADRGVLAGYLRRSGHDILAIGQYLEDEKNGTIKT